MKTRSKRQGMAALLLLLAVPGAAAAQEREDLEMTEARAASALMDNRNTPDRDRAIWLALDLGADASPELKAAVIAAAWAEYRGEIERPEDSHAEFLYLDAVAGLRDPRALPFLMAVPVVASSALADLAPQSFPLVLAAAMNPDGGYIRISGYLEALRFMVEDGSLAPEQLQELRDVARNRLYGVQNHFVVEAAMYLSIALDDPELRQRVETVAQDRSAAEALVSRVYADGSPTDHAWGVDIVQEYARALLSGDLPRPHRDPPR